jgi:hypothetical protein
MYFVSREMTKSLTDIKLACKGGNTRKDRRWAKEEQSIANEQSLLVLVRFLHPRLIAKNGVENGFRKYRVKRTSGLAPSFSESIRQGLIRSVSKDMEAQVTAINRAIMIGRYAQTKALLVESWSVIVASPVWVAE